MKRILTLLLIALALVGCATPPNELIVTKQEVYIPNKSLFKCPYPYLPGHFSSNREVAGTIVRLYGNNMECSNNMKALHQDLLHARNIVKKY